MSVEFEFRFDLLPWDAGLACLPRSGGAQVPQVFAVFKLFEPSAQFAQLALNALQNGGVGAVELLIGFLSVADSIDEDEIFCFSR
jgi:hypothetical protein